jgi:hypothetical protein
MRSQPSPSCPLPRIPPRRAAAWPGRGGPAAAAWLTGLLLLLVALLLGAPPAQAQAVELKQLQLQRRDAELALEFSARLTLGPAIEDALQRGVPLYFTARATVYRDRWYWRDERIARVSRTWRLSWQPLTASWRLSLGGLSQSHGSLSDALAPLSQISGWRIVELDKLEPGNRYHVEFSFGLDQHQLPQPMQIDLGGDWKLGIERSLRVE